MKRLRGNGEAVLSISLLLVFAGVADSRRHHLRGNDDRGGTASVPQDGIGQCDGSMQSLINFANSTASVADISLWYRFQDYEKPLHLRSNGHILAAELDADAGGISFGMLYPSDVEATYKVRRVIVHSPSVHTFDGARVPLEVQLVHEKDDDSGAPEVAIVAVGFFADSLRRSLFMDSLRQGGLPSQVDTETIVNAHQPAKLAFSEIFESGVPSNDNALGTNSQSGFWMYDGSLTTPQCNAKVRWLIRNDALPASNVAVQDFQQALFSKVSETRPLASATLHTSWIVAKDAIQIAPAEPLDPSFSASLETARVAQTYAAQTVSDEEATVAEAQEQGSGQEMIASPGSGNTPSINASFGNHTSRGVGNVGDTGVGTFEYSACMADLLNCETALKSARKRKNKKCHEKMVADGQVKAAGNGISRIQAAMVFQHTAESCDTESEVLQNLLEQQKVLALKCASWKPALPSGQ